MAECNIQHCFITLNIECSSGYLRKSLQLHLCVKSARRHTNATGTVTHVVFNAAEDCMFATLHRTLYFNECNKKGTKETLGVHHVITPPSTSSWLYVCRSIANYSWSILDGVGRKENIHKSSRVNGAWAQSKTHMLQAHALTIKKKKNHF